MANRASKYSGIPRRRYHFPKNRLYDSHISKRRDLYAALDHRQPRWICCVTGHRVRGGDGCVCTARTDGVEHGQSLPDADHAAEPFIGLDGIGMACHPDLGSHDRQRWEF